MAYQGPKEIDSHTPQLVTMTKGLKVCSAKAWTNWLDVFHHRRTFLIRINFIWCKYSVSFPSYISAWYQNFNARYQFLMALSNEPTWQHRSLQREKCLAFLPWLPEDWCKAYLQNMVTRPFKLPHKREKSKMEMTMFFWSVQISLSRKGNKYKWM